MIRTCSIWRALEVVGDVPILLILESIWQGSSRFSQLKDRTGLLKALLSDRLKRLIARDILKKRPAPDSARRQDYVLTGKGQDLMSTVLMLYRWERKWGTADARRNLELRHLTCGEIFTPEMVCGSCDSAFQLSEVSWEKGPGVGWMQPSYSRRRNQTSFQSDRPSLLRGSVELMGDRWSALIMRSVFMKQRRFDEISAETAIAPNILADRLKKLTGSNVLKAKAYQDNPVRFEYFLTSKGFDYYSVIMMLMLWGDKYYASPEGPPVHLTHMSCGKPLNPKISCSACHGSLAPQNMEVVG